MPDAVTLDRFYIDGAWTTPSGAQTMPILDPATEASFGTVTLGDARDVDRAVAAAARAFESFSRSSVAERVALLERIDTLTRARRAELAQATSLEMGAPITFAREVQTDAAIGQLGPFVEALKALETRTILPSGDVEILEPVGVVGMIAPWNWPLYQVVLKVLPAIAAGCTAVLKPSEHTPLTATIYAEILHEAGVPPGVVNLVQGDGPTVGAALSRHPDVAMMSFTGSLRGGTAVTRDAADTVKRVVLELGGKSPNLVFADCPDLETRVSESFAECINTNGQACDAPTRMLVERSVYDDAVEIARRAAEATRVGPPDREGDHIGPVVNQAQFDRVQALIRSGIDEGARLVAGGPGRPEGLNRGWYVRPTVFADVTPEMRVTREEIFGPVLVMMPFEDEDEAVRLANDTPYGLAAYMQTGDPARAERVAARLRAGAVHVNGAAMEYGTAFGGMRQSGNGREGGMHGLREYYELKTLHLPPDWPRA